MDQDADAAIADLTDRLDRIQADMATKTELEELRSEIKEMRSQLDRRCLSV